MDLYRLLAGIHIQADHEWKPSEEDKLLAETRGIVPRAPSRTYKEGALVPSETDLVEKLGPQKFAYVVEKTKKGKSGKGAKGEGLGRQMSDEGEEYGTPGDIASWQYGAAVAPGGQVSTGFQSTTSMPDGTVVSGQASEDTIRRLMEENRELKRKLVESTREEKVRIEDLRDKFKEQAKSRGVEKRLPDSDSSSEGEEEDDSDDDSTIPKVRRPATDTPSPRGDAVTKAEAARAEKAEMSTASSKGEAGESEAKGEGEKSTPSSPTSTGKGGSGHTPGSGKPGRPTGK